MLWEWNWASALGLEGRLHGVTEDYILGGKGAGLVMVICTKRNSCTTGDFAISAAKRTSEHLPEHFSTCSEVLLHVWERWLQSSRQSCPGVVIRGKKQHPRTHDVDQTIKQEEHLYPCVSLYKHPQKNLPPPLLPLLPQQRPPPSIAHFPSPLPTSKLYSNNGEART